MLLTGYFIRYHFSETPTLVLLKDLDAETQEYFSMTLVAFSPSRGTSDQLNSHLQIEIYVVDMNDNEPYFDQSSYNVTVPEDTLPGSVVFQVRFVKYSQFECMLRLE